MHNNKPILTREEARQFLSDLKTAYLSLPANDRASVGSALARHTPALVQATA